MYLQASCILQLMKYILKLQTKEVPVAEEVMALFAGELNPVAPKAQKKVPIPEGYVVVNPPPPNNFLFKLNLQRCTGCGHKTAAAGAAKKNLFRD